MAQKQNVLEHLDNQQKTGGAIVGQLSFLCDYGNLNI